MKKCCILAMAMIMFTAMSAAQEPGKAVWNFDKDKVGSVAAGFTVAAGEWKVVADPTAPSQPNVLAQSARSSGSTFNIVLVDNTSYKDFDLTVRMKAVAGKEDQGGGLVWRAKDARNYYIARYNPLEDNYRLYKVVDGRRSELKSVNIKHGDGWHTLMVTMKGTRIECYYDGRKYLEADDSTFKEAGKIGLWSKADAQSRFDDLTVAAK